MDWIMSKVPIITTEQLVATLEESAVIAYVFFKGRLTRDILAQGQNWLLDAAERIGVEALRGVILDFRQVRIFDRLTAIKNTGKLIDMSLVPHALVAQMHQEQMVSLCFGEQSHKMIVTSDKEALCFVDEWNRLHERGFEGVARSQYDDITVFNRYVLTEQMRARGC